jgi:hypothetical protein
MDIEQHPETLRPFVRMNAPNEPLRIREGNFEIATDRFTIGGRGHLELRWFPRIHVAGIVDTEYTGPFDVGELREVTLTDVGASLEYPAIIRQRDTTRGMRFEVQAFGVDFGTSQLFDTLTLHVVNFPDLAGWYVRDQEAQRGWSGRIEFVVHGWTFILDQLANHEKMTEALETQGGYAITHTCSLRRSDGAPFRYRDARPALSGLAFLLALVRGAWSSPIALVGSTNGAKVWERWDTLARHDAWTGSTSWWHSSTRNILNELAVPVFDAVAADEDSAAAYAITWYTQVKRTEDSVETPLILCQAALEMLAWHIAVRRDGSFSPDGFNRLRAEDRLRYLFSVARFDTSVPSVYPELQAFSQEHNWEDIAQAICLVRNSAIHPPKKHGPIERIPVEVRICASQMAIWALELCLLYLFDYQGDYANRLRDFHPPERVPWSRGEPGGAHPPWDPPPTEACA